MNIAVQWQDSDASSAKSIKESFQVMICGGHAGNLKTFLNVKYQSTQSKISKY